MSINETKFNDLRYSWAVHERWIQSNCTDPSDYRIEVPGYRFISGQGEKPYLFYRSSFLPFFTDILGWKGVHEELYSMYTELKGKHPSEIEQIFIHYKDPPNKFLHQWENLFENFAIPKLSHQTVLSYQQKYELEFPLLLLSTLRELDSKGTLDISLDRFKDSNSKYKKGVLSRYIIDGFSSFPKLNSLIKKSYLPKLRNAIGHNEYKIEHDSIIALDNSFSLSSNKFWACLEALQTLQNSLLWLINKKNTFDVDLCRFGILGIGWYIDEHDALCMNVFQIAPFFNIRSPEAWVNSIIIELSNQSMDTYIGKAPIIKGPIVQELTSKLKKLKIKGRIDCEFIPVMPCVHEHETIDFPDGNYCQTQGSLAFKFSVSVKTVS